MAIALHYDHRIHAVVQYMDLPAVKQMAFTFVGTSASTGKLHVFIPGLCIRTSIFSSTLFKRSLCASLCFLFLRYYLCKS